MVIDKVTLRTGLLAGRARRSPAARAAAARAVAGHLRTRMDAAGVVAGYVPTAEEPGAGQLPGALAGPDRRVLLPVVPPAGRELAWAVWAGPLVTGRFGLLEPTGPRLPAAALAEADLVVVPALAVALDGSRLGRGGGFYDRALAHARADAVRVAVVFDEELLDAVPTEPHDIGVQAVVTPSGGWRSLGPP